VVIDIDRVSELVSNYGVLILSTKSGTETGKVLHKGNMVLLFRETRSTAMRQERGMDRAVEIVGIYCFSESALRPQLNYEGVLVDHMRPSGIIEVDNPVGPGI
jgi:hypothetical protein